MNDKYIRPNCEYAADIVEYMYGEMPLAPSAKFESHLADCVLCIEEFAAISEARFEVYEWRRLEFAPMETPEIVIPFAEASRNESSTVRLPWYRKLSEAFSFSPGFAAAAAGFTTIAIAAGVTFFAMRGDDRNVVGVSENHGGPFENVKQIDAGLKPSKDLQSESVKASVELKAENPEPVTKRAPLVPKRAAARLAAKNRVARNVDTPVQAVKSRVPERQTSRPLPGLNDFDDDEDNSLRLAQLFEDIETSD